MEQKNKKVLIILIIALIVVAIIFLIINKNNKKKAEIFSINQDAQLSPILLTENKKLEMASAKDIVGKINSINVDAIEIATSKGDNLKLNVPREGASFLVKTVQKDGSFLNKEIGLFDMPKNEDVEIKYNSKTKDVILVVVK